MVNSLVPEATGQAHGPRPAGPATSTAPARPAVGGRVRSRRRQAAVAYLFLAPTLLFFAVFLILPLGFALLLSMSHWAGFALGDIRPVGLDNFTGLFADGSTFLAPILTNTLLFALGTVALALAGSVLVATCIDNLRFQGCGAPCTSCRSSRPSSPSATCGSTCTSRAASPTASSTPSGWTRWRSSRTRTPRCPRSWSSRPGPRSARRSSS